MDDTNVEVKRRPRVGRAIAQRVASSAPSVENLITADDDAEIKQLMVECISHNELMNAHKKTYEASRAKLLKKLKEFNKESYTYAEATVNGRACSLDAEVDAPTSRAIDIAKLKKLVGIEVFMRCVTAAVGTVQNEAGANVVNQCSYDKKGTENVSVKARARNV